MAVLNEEGLATLIQKIHEADKNIKDSIPQASEQTPASLSMAEAKVGTSPNYARADHVHSIKDIMPKIIKRIGWIIKDVKETNLIFHGIAFKTQGNTFYQSATDNDLELGIGDSQTESLRNNVKGNGIGIYSGNSEYGNITEITVWAEKNNDTINYSATFILSDGESVTCPVTIDTLYGLV